MNILFITKPYVIDHLGIAYLSAALKKEGHKVEICLCDEKKDLDILCYEILRFSPDILAYSVTTGNHNFYLKLNNDIRYYLKKNHPHTHLISIFGGAHCTYFPEFIKEKNVDIIFIGESDISLPKFVKEYSEYNRCMELKKVITSEIVDVNVLELPDRELIYKYPKNRDNPIKNIITSRGCPFACTFCYNSVYKKLYGRNPLRYREIESVIQEAEQIFKNYPKTEMIFFEDDEFVASYSRLEKFSKLWIERIKKPYHAQLRIELLDERKIKLLKESGCISITFAIETGNEYRRRELLNKTITNKQILDGAKLLHKYKMPFRTENMLCLPFETLKEALETLELNIKCKPDIAWASLYQPYPKTPLGELCREKGLFLGNIEDIPSSFFERSILKIDEKEKKKFENLQRLFSFIVSFPILRYLLPILLIIPHNKFYNWLYKKWKIYLYDKKLYNTKGVKNG